MDALSNDEQVLKPTSLDQVKSVRQPDLRARAGIDFAAIAERNAEASFAKGDMNNMAAQLTAMKKSLEIARDAFIASKETPGRNPQLYKYAELHSRELLVRLEDFERRMFAEDRDLVAVPKARVQEIHDLWLDGILSQKSKRCQPRFPDTERTRLASRMSKSAIRFHLCHQARHSRFEYAHPRRERGALQTQYIAAAVLFPRVRVNAWVSRWCSNVSSAC